MRGRPPALNNAGETFSIPGVQDESQTRSGQRDPLLVTHYSCYTVTVWIGGDMGKVNITITINEEVISLVSFLPCAGPMQG